MNSGLDRRAAQHTHSKEQTWKWDWLDARR
jgi:hypothetical protein